MVSLEILHMQPQRKAARAPDFKAIIIDRQTNRASDLRIVAMAKRIDQSLTKRHGRKERLIYAFK